MKLDMGFYAGRRVFVTGHTGFKGAWMCRILTDAGARVTGYALPPGDPSLFEALHLESKMASRFGDIHDLPRLLEAYEESQPEIVFHLAAQPLVREGYARPVDTFETNVMGTVHLLECMRKIPGARSLVNVTTDKVYENREWAYPYRETDRLCGYDPYASSKSCSELVTSCYQNAFLKDLGVSVSTARAGNVIGGGDFAADRMIPDCYRAATRGESVVLRNPGSTRPYQHVLEPVCAYLLIASRQYKIPSLAGCYNIGPEAEGCVCTRQLAALFCDAWGPEASFREEPEPNAPRETNCLRLECGKIKEALGWRPQWDIAAAVERTVEWYQTFASGGDVDALTGRQIQEYLMER